PRCGREVQRVHWLPAPFHLRDVISLEAMQSLCRSAGLEIEVLAPVIGTLGTLANQVARAAGTSRILVPLSYPLRVALSGLDVIHGSAELQRASSAWVLLARHAVEAERS